MKRFDPSVLLLLVVPLANAADWPRLGGPEGTGASSETGLARHWPADGPRVRWTANVAEGFAGPAVGDDQVFLLDRESDQKDVLRCLDLNTGRDLWTLAYIAPGKLPYDGSRNVPTLDKQYVFVVGPFGQFHCIARRTHQILWARHLVNDFKDPLIDTDTPPATREDTLARAQVPMWGLTQAPLLYRDLVIVAPQTQKTGLVAYEKATGNIRWRSDYIGRNWYSHVSPTLVTLGGVDQVIMLAQPSDPEKAPDKAPPAIVSAIAPDTGRILWTTQTPGPAKIPIPQPLRVADDRLFITGGYGLGCLMFEVTCVAGQWKTKVLFHNKNAAVLIHSPVLYQDRIYVSSPREQGGLSTGLVCLNLTGERLWQTGPGLQFENGPFLIADGLAFALHGKTGQLHLIELSAEGPRLLAQAKVLAAEHGNAWAPMALARGRLLVRDQHQLICLEVKTASQ